MFGKEQLIKLLNKHGIKQICRYNIEYKTYKGRLRLQVIMTVDHLLGWVRVGRGWVFDSGIVF